MNKSDLHTINILGIIPARGGSKGVPRKNIRMLAGRPLIEYTLSAAKKSEFLNKIIVSTDDSEIAQISGKNDVEVILRPDSLAQDTSPVIDALYHVMDALKKNSAYSPDIIVLLQPTSPLRNSDDIDSAIRIFLTGNFNSVISVCETDHSPYWCFTMSNNKSLKPIFNKKFLFARRQDLPETFRPNGAIYISSPATLKKHSGFFTNNTGSYIMPADRCVDIDRPVDFRIAEFLLEKGTILSD